MSSQDYASDCVRLHFAWMLRVVLQQSQQHQQHQQSRKNSNAINKGSSQISNIAKYTARTEEPSKIYSNKTRGGNHARPTDS